ncbi:DUF2523 domain-containing protein [Acinetobacter junii]|uniref:DUF2523 family protein n=1 Tax=Acinetobacter junii TaxID=40215 RepID=UPI0012986FF5|nr:DUF2523 family protein [Acinetobacter junii]MQZ56012.1 DUF2523 domain-containing protein [Acinetobacter junii]
MASTLSTLFASLQKGFLKNVLTGAGITLATGGAILTALNTAVNQFKSSLGAVSSTLLQLAGVCGFDIAFSIVLGAIAARYVQNSAKLYLSRR